MEEIGYRYSSYSGNDASVTLPDKIDGKPLKIIGNKAFLSCKTVEKVQLPLTVTTLEDWAFAHMKNLTEITLPAHNYQWGKQVFLGCNQLSHVYFSNVEEILPGLDVFLADALIYFPESGLEDFAKLTTREGQMQWLSSYDEALAEFICAPDDAGYVPAFVGWFDVEDLDDQKVRYMEKQVLLKIKLLFQRLFPQLPCEKESLFQNYLKEHADFLIQALCNGGSGKFVPHASPDHGKANTMTSEDPLYQLVDDISFYKVLSNADALSPADANRLLIALPDLDPQVKTYLIQLQFQEQNTNQLFSDLEL